MSPKRPEDDDRLVEQIYDALDEGTPERALAAARIALHDAPGDPVLHFLAGVALREMDQTQEALLEFDRAIELDPDDPEFRAARAQAHFSTCGFAAAKDDATAALATDSAHADASYVLALLVEREQRYGEADALFDACAQADPDRFQAPVRWTRDRFNDVVARAGTMLPEMFQSRLDEVPVVVDDLPSDEMLTDEAPPLDPELLGLFVGTALTERTFAAPGVEPPPRIYLFQRNLERFSRNETELATEIARTLHHELAHYLGFAEEDMAELDLD